MKKTPGEIIILHKCTKTHDHRLYCSWDMACNRIVTSHFGLFIALLPPSLPEKWKYENLKKKTGDIIILHNCTKNHDHRLYCSWDMACDGCNCFSFWTIFCPLTPLTAQKPIFQKNEKTAWRYNHFTYVHQKLWLDNYSFWDMVHDGRMDRWMKKWHTEVGAPPKNSKTFVHLKYQLPLMNIVVKIKLIDLQP